MNKIQNDRKGLILPTRFNDRVRQSVFTLACGLITGMLTAGLTVSANATTVNVQVLNASNNQPVKGAAVCLDRAGKKFGAQRTDDKGVARFPDLPKTGLLVTVSLDQHKGIQRPVTTGDIDWVRTIHLPKGGHGPACDAPPKLLYSSKTRTLGDGESLLVANFNIDKGHEVTKTRRVVLSPRILGKPTHYRISENPQFEGTQWMEYQKTPIFTLSEGDGRKKVYFQIRRAAEVDDGTIQTLSNVSSDLITLKSE